jgi:hypothetical protein
LRIALVMMREPIEVDTAVPQTTINTKLIVILARNETPLRYRYIGSLDKEPAAEMAPHGSVGFAFNGGSRGLNN